MFRSLKIFTPVSAALVFVFAAGPGIAQELGEFSAYYQARTNGMRGEAERHLLRQADGHYRLDVSLEARMLGVPLGKLKQSSVFKYEYGIIQPADYSYQVTGITRDYESVDFDWDTGSALSQEDDNSWTVELGDTTLDQLSYQVALALRLEEGNAGIGDEFEFEIVDGPNLETHLYRLTAEEILETPLGELNTVKLERIRNNNSGRVTNIWLARDWDYVITKIEQNNPDGLRLKLELENAILNGQPVQPLP